MYMFLPISCGFYHKESFSCTEFDLVKAWLKTTKKNNEAYFNLVSRYFLSSLNEPWFFASKSLSIFLSRNPLNIHVPILGLQSKPSQDPISLMKRIFEPKEKGFLPVFARKWNTTLQCVKWCRDVIYFIHDPGQKIENLLPDKIFKFSSPLGDNLLTSIKNFAKALSQIDHNFLLEFDI